MNLNPLMRLTSLKHERVIRILWSDALLKIVWLVIAPFFLSVAAGES
jgi:hypothetical protein